MYISDYGYVFSIKRLSLSEHTVYETPMQTFNLAKARAAMANFNWSYDICLHKNGYFIAGVPRTTLKKVDENFWEGRFCLWKTMATG